jgi:hypothetical protein
VGAFRCPHSIDKQEAVFMSDGNITKNDQNHSILDEVSIDESKINELIEKYDAESRYRKLKIGRAHV